MREAQKDKRQGSSGSGKSPSKVMERPASKSRKEQPEQELSHPEFIDEGLDALENQEKVQNGEGDETYEGWNPPPPPKSDPKLEKRKSQEPAKKDSSSDNAGDCACA